jgi:hypothetical protein
VATRRYNELVRDWPGSAGEDQIRLRQLWDALTPAEQREAYDNAVRYRASVGGGGKRKRVLLWKYLREKRWQALPPPRPKRAPDDKPARLPDDMVLRFLAADPDMALAACVEDWVLALVQFIAGHHRRPDSGEAAGLRASGRRSMEEWRRLAAAASGVKKRGAAAVVAKEQHWRASIEAAINQGGQPDDELHRKRCT